MNTAATEEQSETEGFQGPGLRLKTIREAQGLELSQVASMLHLNRSTLTALEADDYSAMPGSVFVQGYLRNYARLLGVPAAPILNAFQETRPTNEPLPDLVSAQVRHELRSSHLMVRLITWSLVIGLIVLVVIWWRGYLNWPQLQESDLPQAGVEQETPRITAESDSAADSSEPAPGADQEPLPVGEPDTEVIATPSGAEGGLTIPPLEEPEESQLSEPVESAVLSLEDASPETPADTSPETPTETLPEQEPEAILPEAEAVTSLPEPDPVALEPAVEVDTGSGDRPLAIAPEPADRPEPVGLKQLIRIVFEGPCWTDIRDSSGRFRIFGKKASGESYLLGGTPPYQVILGDAHVVQITIDGEAYDLMPHTRGNVARFTLDPEQ